MNIITANKPQRTLSIDELRPAFSGSGVTLRIDHLPPHVVGIQLTKAELQELCQKAETAR